VARLFTQKGQILKSKKADFWQQWGIFDENKQALRLEN